MHGFGVAETDPLLAVESEGVYCSAAMQLFAFSSRTRAASNEDNNIIRTLRSAARILFTLIRNEQSKSNQDRSIIFLQAMPGGGASSTRCRCVRRWAGFCSGTTRAWSAAPCCYSSTASHSQTCSRSHNIPSHATHSRQELVVSVTVAGAIVVRRRNACIRVTPPGIHTWRARQQPLWPPHCHHRQRAYLVCFANVLCMTSPLQHGRGAADGAGHALDGAAHWPGRRRRGHRCVNTLII